MRETFEDLGSLLGYYRFLKCSVISMPSIPKKDFGDNTQKFRAKMQQMAIEDKYAFIGDVESFINAYYIAQNTYVPIPLKMVNDIFMSQFCFYPEPYTYTQLARKFRREKKQSPQKIPYRMLHRQGIEETVSDMKESMESYFMIRGLLKK